MTRRKRKIGFLKTLLTTTALFACPAIAEDYISIIDQGNGALLIQNGGKFPRTAPSDLLKNATTVTIDTTNGSSHDFTTEDGGSFAVGLENPGDEVSLSKGDLVFKNLGTLKHSMYYFGFKARNIQIESGNFTNSSGSYRSLEFSAGNTISVGKNASFSATTDSIILFKANDINFSGSLNGDGIYQFDGTLVFNSENVRANEIRFSNGGTSTINGKWDFVNEFLYTGRVILNNDITVGYILALNDAYLSGNHTLTINAAKDSVATFVDVGQYDSASDTFSDPLKELNISTTSSSVLIGTPGHSEYTDGTHTFYVQKMSVGGAGSEHVNFAATNGKIEDLLLTHSKATVYSEGKMIIDKLTLSDSTLTVGRDGVLVLGDVTHKGASKLAMSLHSTLLYKNGGTLDLSTLDLTEVTGTSDVYATIGNYSDSTALTFAADADKYKNIIAKGYVDLNNSAFYGVSGGNWVVSGGTVKADYLYADTAKTSTVKSGAVFNPSKIVQTADIFPTYKVDGQLNVSDVVVWDKAFSRYYTTKWLGTLTGNGTVFIQSDIAGFTGVFDNLGTLRLGADLNFTGQNNANNANGSSVIKNLEFSSSETFNLLSGKLTVNALSGSGKIKLNSGSTLYFDVNGTLPANISGTGTLGLLNSSKLELSAAAVGDLTLEGLEIDGKAEAVIKADISIDKLKFMQDTGGTLGIDSGKTLTVKSGVTMGTGNKIDGANGALIVQGDSSFSNTVLGTLTAQKATFKGGNSTIGTYNAQGDVVVEAGTTLKVANAFDLSGGYHVSGDGSLTVGAGGKIATGDKVLANLTINGETTFYADSTIGTLKVTDGVTAKVATDKTLTISKSFSGAINAGEGSKTTLRLIDSAQADFKAGDSTKMARFVMEGADARAAFYGNYSLNEMELKQGTIVLADGAVLSLSHGILSGGNITGGGTLNLTAQNTEITETGNYTLSHLTFGNGGALTLNGTLTMLNDTNVKDSGLSGSGTLNFGANGTVGGGKFDGTISVGQNKVTVESDMTLGTFKFTQSAGGTLWINDNVTLTVGKLQGVGSNTVRGGILKLLSGGEIGNVNITGELSLGGDTTITGDSVIDTVTITGDVIIADGVTLTVNKKLDLSPNNNIVYGAQNTGTLVLNGSDNKIATKTKILGTLRIGESGAVTFYDDAVIGTLDSRGTTTVAAGKTLTIRQSYGGKLSASDATLKLTETAQGTFAAGDGSTIGRLEIAGDGAKATFNGAYALKDLTLSKGQVEINDVLTLTQGAFTGGTVGGTGSLKLAGTLTIGAGAGVSISNLTFDTNGKLNLNGQLTVNNELDYRGHLVDAGNGTLTLGAKGTFGGTFNGTVRVGQTTAEIAENAVFKALEFTGTGGVLTIADSATLEIAALDAAGNTVSGGNLKLTNGAVFDTANLNDLTAWADVVVNKSLTVNGALSAASVSGDGELTLTNGGSLTTGGKVLGTLSGGQATITGDSTVGALNADVSINAGKTLTITKSVKDGITALGDGLLLLDGASADFGSANIKNLKLNNAQLSLSGVLMVDSLQAGDEPSTLTGGTLALAGNAAFNGKMDVDTLQINAGLVLTNDTTVNTLDFGGSGALTLSGGLTVNGSLNLTRDIAGNGTLIAAGDAVLGANFGGTLQIGTDAKAGTATVVSDATFGGLTFGGKGGAVEINAGKRLSVPTVSVASGGTVAGDGTLALTGTGSVLGANLSVAGIELSGQATAQTASVNGLTLKNGGRVDVENGLSVAKLKQTGTDGVINGGTLTVQSAAVENSLTLNNAAATIGSLSGAGVLRLNGSDTVLSQANIGTLAVSGGTLNIGKNQITANAFTMENGTLKLQIGKNATDGNGNATGVGHGKITGGTTVSNSALSIEVEYNTYIPKNGVVFKLFDGSQNGAFAEVANEKYKITAESNGNYRIAKLHTSAENAGNAGGNKNQQNTAEGLLDHPPFDEGDKTYGLADELNRLEQSDKQGFLDGLTAAAPDVSGAVSAAHLRSQRVINSMTVKRLTALHDKLGRSSYGFRRDQKLMRGMRRGRSGGSRYYDARKYYQKAYGRGAARSSVRNKPYENYWSNGLAEYQNWRTPTASVWAETLLNKTTYKDDGKPDGFSGTSTGFTVGLDAVMMDIAAAGVGYAHTTTDITALNRKTTFTSNMLFVYGTFKPNETYLSAIVNFGAGSYDEDKTVGTLKLSDAYDAKQYGVQITAGGNFDVYNPSVGLRYSAANLDAREDSAGQKVAAQSFKTLTLSVDNRWELPLMQTKWTKTGMNLNVGAAYDISRSADKAEVALTNGASYTVEGAKPDALTFNAGAEVYWIFGRKISLSAKYDADIASSYLSHSVSANLSFLF